MMIRCLSYRNIMSDKVYKKKHIEVLVCTIMFNCFQSVEIKESRGSFPSNIKFIQPGNNLHPKVLAELTV